MPEVAEPTETGNRVSDTAAAAPDDADDLRGFHFKRLVRKRLTWILTLCLAVVAAGVCGALIGPVLGAVGAAAVILIALLVVFVIADSKAEEELDVDSSGAAAVIPYGPRWVLLPVEQNL